LHNLLRFCHLLLTAEHTGTDRVRTGGHRPQIEIEFSKAIDRARPYDGFRQFNLESCRYVDTDRASDLTHDEMLA
jgi:hypothetical protein